MRFVQSHLILVTSETPEIQGNERELGKRLTQNHTDTTCPESNFHFTPCQARRELTEPRKES